MTTQFTAIVWGDAPYAFSFEPQTPEQELAHSIRRDFQRQYDKIRAEAHKLYPLRFSIRKRSVTGDKAGKEAYTTTAMQSAGIRQGDAFYQTPMGRVEWQYVDTRMGDPNFADTDRSVFQFTLIVP